MCGELFSRRTSSAGICAALVTNVVHSELIVLNLNGQLVLQRFRESGQTDVGDFSATVAEKVIVRLHNFVKAIGHAVDVQALDDAELVHGVEVIIDGCHGNTGHFQLG